MSTSKITIHMVASLDGFIAKQDGDISWMQSTDSYKNGVVLTEEYINEFLAGIDCYLMGSKTYEHALRLGWPYGDVPVIVLSSRKLNSDKSNVSFYSGNLKTLVASKLRPNYNNIWMVGGANTTKSFIQSGLADEIVMSILPVLLGNGTLFFDFVGIEQKLHLKDVTAFSDGMVELTYEILKRATKP